MKKKRFYIDNKYSLRSEIIILLLFILSLTLIFPTINLLSNTVLPFIYVLLSESFDVVNYGNKIPVTGRMASNCAMPYVTILIQGRRKSLELTCDDQESLESYEKVECSYSVGCFGWAYIHDYVAIKWSNK